MTRSLGRRCLVAAAALVLIAVVTQLRPNANAHADTLLVESFTNGSVSNSTDWLAGGSGTANNGWPGSACLTAGSDTTQTPIPGCGLGGAADAAGSGALRFTSPANSLAGFVLYNHALPTTGGLDITFDQAQYGGSGADGISFFMVDGSTNLTSPGAAGGGLGYTAGKLDGGGYIPGVAHGLLGVGIDKWGNFASDFSSGQGCAPGTGTGSSGPGQTPNVVTVRGAGNGTTGYCWLGSSADLGSTLTSGGNRTDATVQVHIVVDPSTVADRKVTVSLNGALVLQIPVPQELVDAAAFKFGFAGSTGSVTDVHEVWDLQINSVIPVPPTTTVRDSTVPTVPESPSTTQRSVPRPTATPTTLAPAPVATPQNVSPTYTG